MPFRKIIAAVSLAGCLASPVSAQYNMPSPVFTAAIGNGPGMMVWEQGKASGSGQVCGRAYSDDDEKARLLELERRGQCGAAASGGGAAAPSFTTLTGAVNGLVARDTQPRAEAGASNLSFSPSAQRRRANLAQFVTRTRADNPESAAQMERLFASTDVLGQVQSALAPYGYSVANVGDAYAFWWMTAWEGARGSNRAFSRAEMQAVQAQARAALASTPAMAAATDAQKQEMAEAMWIQAAMIDGMIDLAKEQPNLMPQVQQAVRQGARASGLDLNAMRLTESGFVPG